MTDQRDESLMDKVKNAFGMGSHDDHEHDHVDDVDTTRADVPGSTTYDDVDTTRADVPGRTAFDDDLSDSGNRPAGPDYGASDTTDAGFGTTDAVETVEVDYGSPATTVAPGTEFETDVDGGPTTMHHESGWTSEGAGESTLDSDEDLDADRRDPLV